MSNYDRKNQRSNSTYGKSKYLDYEEEKKFDIGAIIKYLFLTVVFSVIIYGMKMIVLAATQASPTNAVGNGMLSLYEIHNTGAAFSLFKGQPEMLIMASFLTVAILAFIVLIKSAKLTQSAISAMALLSSGIIMNMYERITQGYVIDYIHCDFMPTIPVFNTADIMIVCGAIGLMLAILIRK